MAFTFKLVTVDDTPADPRSFTTVAPQWRPGDRIPLGPGRALRVVGVRVTDVDETPVLIVEDVSDRAASAARRRSATYVPGGLPYIPVTP
jgi:hypothetical protein